MQRERESLCVFESVCMSVCVRERECVFVSVCMSVCERERVYVCV